MFRSWKYQDQSRIDLGLIPGRIHYIHSRAWSIKGWLGGTHSYLAFWSSLHATWLVAEITDRETLDVQGGTPLHMNAAAGYTERVPVISARHPDAKWFGSSPILIGSTLWPCDGFDAMTDACLKYPIRDFNLITANCNTFTSFLIWYLGLPLSRPLRSVGYRGRSYWTREC